MTDIAIALLIVILAGLFVLATAVMRAVWIIPQARARNVERLGRYHRTLEPGIIPASDAQTDSNSENVTFTFMPSGSSVASTSR
ncbi:hypothetical protein [Actinomadura sp. BRA 177]|uniref:hypothetical protein n=1 Tax=Actinomadura sp. BRA 177 TaxID=2745202 RepID=UPI001C3DCC4F|nr:hypothetical protein [Actinomadura sp. BRA 177]